MTQYVKLEPAFSSSSTLRLEEPSFSGSLALSDSTFSVVLFIIIVVVGLAALHALGKKALEVHLREETNEEED